MIPSTSHITPSVLRTIAIVAAVFASMAGAAIAISVAFWSGRGSARNSPNA